MTGYEYRGVVYRLLDDAVQAMLDNPKEDKECMFERWVDNNFST